MEFAPANETNIADFYGRRKWTWAWFPQGIPIGRIFDRKPLAENVVVSHQGMFLCNRGECERGKMGVKYPE